jgi:hypothetical protein
LSFLVGTRPSCRISWQTVVGLFRSTSGHGLRGPLREGELSEGVNFEALANLCLTLLSGLTFRVLDGAPPGLLFRSIGLFVDALGFRMRRTKRAKKARK